TASPGIRRRSAILIRLGEAIPFGRPYCTHLNGPRKLLTARKRVGPLPTHRLASRHASPRSSDHHSSSSSLTSDSLPVHSSGLDASDHAHSGSSTRDVTPRLCYPPRRAPRRSEAFCRWCAAPLSTLYPPTTSESSSGDSSERPLHSSSHSAGPSRKRCRSPVDSVPSSTPVMGSLAPTRVDLLLPRKRFRDLYSSEASIEEDTEIDPIETKVDMELGIGDGDDVRDHVEIDPRDVRDDTEEYEADTSAGDTVEVGIDPMSAPIVEEEIVEPAGEDSSDSSGTRDGIVRSFEDMPIDLDDVVRDFYHHMSEAFRRWCAAPLSTLYPPTTSESSSGDSSERPLHSSSHSARPYRNRCRSPIDFVPSSTLVMGSLAPTRANLLPPRKKFRDSYSSEASIEEDTEIDPIETEVDMELGIGDGDDVEIMLRLTLGMLRMTQSKPAGEDASDSSGTRDGIVKSFKDMPIDLNDVVHDFYHHMSKVRIDRIIGIETAQRRLEVDQSIARGQRVSMIERIDNLRLENLKVCAMLDIERDRVNSLRLHMSLS
ncbi:hypothetical protein Tco_0855780, partial [Tanacetum coccineum]